MNRYSAVCGPLLLSLLACGSGPPVRIYVLTPPREPEANEQTRALPSGPSESAAQLVVRRVRVPDYLDTTDILLRDGRNEVKSSTSGQWGERLSEGLTHVLAADLEARLPLNEVVLDTGNPARRLLLININSLDLWPDGRCVMAATWSIIDHDAPQTIVTGSGTFDATPTESIIAVGDARLVEAVSRAVGKLADSIAPRARLSAEQSSLHGN